MTTDFERYEADLKRKRRLILPGILLVIALFAGGTWALLDSSTTLERDILHSLPSDMSESVRGDIAEALAAWGTVCPGLANCKKSLRFVEARTSSPYYPPSETGLPKEVSVTWLLFTLDEDSAYAARHNANGHTLWVGVVENGAALVMKKRATQAVFLDKNIADTGRDLIIPLI